MGVWFDVRLPIFFLRYLRSCANISPIQRLEIHGLRNWLHSARPLSEYWFPVIFNFPTTVVASGIQVSQKINVDKHRSRRLRQKGFDATPHLLRIKIEPVIVLAPQNYTSMFMLRIAFCARQPAMISSASLQCSSPRGVWRTKNFFTSTKFIAPSWVNGVGSCSRIG